MLPLYEYQCSECQNTIFVRHSIKETLEESFCDFCKKNTSVKRLISLNYFIVMKPLYKLYPGKRTKVVEKEGHLIDTGIEIK